MTIVLFDTSERENLFPFTHTRPSSSLRCGIYTIQEKWNYYLNTTTYQWATPIINNTLEDIPTSHEYLYIKGNIFPNHELVQTILDLNLNECILFENEIIAFRTQNSIENFDRISASDYQVKYSISSLDVLSQVWEIFTKNGQQIELDFEIISKGKKSKDAPNYATILYPENVFIEEGAIINPCIINAKDSKIYIGRNAEIMEGSMLRGNISIGENAVIKMGSKIYGDTTIGPGCKVGGEIQNVVFYANSNKGHDGYLGNAVIGEWCNLGADTNCSNLKNDYRKVDIFHEASHQMIDTGLQFCGLIMGDHSKCSINSMFNTGTVVGVSCNLFGSDFPPKFIPSFTWGGAGSMTNFRLDKAIDAANRMMERRGKKLSDQEIKMFTEIYERIHSK